MKKNPFPGMNPWLEEFWRDVHAHLLVYACDQLNLRLPEDLSASIDERLAVDLGEAKPRSYVPDVAISESWDASGRPSGEAGGVAVEAATPVIVEFSDFKRRHLKIADSRDHIVTVLEALSPSNKSDEVARDHWEKKRSDTVDADINFVELDLIRAGGWALPDHCGTLEFPKGRVCHAASAIRAANPNRCAFYLLPLRELLPAIRIPLRIGERDVALDLQELIDRCYEGGRYDRKINYSCDPQPPLPPEELAWARELVTGR